MEVLLLWYYFHSIGVLIIFVKSDIHCNDDDDDDNNDDDENDESNKNRYDEAE